MKGLEVRESEVSGKTFNDLAEDEKLVIERHDEGWANEVAGYSDWDAATQVAEVVRFHPPALILHGGYGWRPPAGDVSKRTRAGERSPPSPLFWNAQITVSLYFNSTSRPACLSRSTMLPSTSIRASVSDCGSSPGMRERIFPE